MPNATLSPVAEREFEALLQDAEPYARRVALRTLRNHDDAEDALQYARIRAWQNLPKLKRKDTFAGWFTRIVWGRCMTMLRDRKRKSWIVSIGFESDSEQWAADGNGPQETVLQAEIVREARLVIHALPAWMQATLRLSMDGMERADIAATLGLKCGTVGSRNCRARRAFAGEWKRRERRAESALLRKSPEGHSTEARP